MVSTRITAPATITSPRPGAITGIAARSGVVIAAEPLEHRLGRRRAAAGSGGSPRGRIARGRGPPPGWWSPCPRRDTMVRAVCIVGHGDLGRIERVGDRRTDRGQLLRPGGSVRTWRSVRRTDPICVLMSASARPGSAPDHELGRSPADVDEQERAVGGREPARAAEERQAAPPRRRRSPRGRCPAWRRTIATNSVPVGGIAHRARRRDANPRRAQGAGAPAVAGEDRLGARERLGVQQPGRVHALRPAS